MSDSTRLSSYLEDFFPPSRVIRFSLKLILVWGSYRTLLLNTDEERKAYEGDRFKRGDYSILKRTLVLQEKFGLFRIEIPAPQGPSLRVFPETAAERPSPPVQRMIRQTVDSRRSVLKDRSFYESRLYYPGDDTRRINWNLKARHGDLFVREGSHGRPAGKSVLILINGEGDFSDCDLFCRESLSLWEALCDKNCSISLFFSGMPSIQSGGAELIREDLEDLLAGLPPLSLVLPDNPVLAEFGAVYLYSCMETLPPLRGEGLRGGQKTLITRASPDAEEGAMRKNYEKGGWNVFEI